MLSFDSLSLAASPMVSVPAPAEQSVPGRAQQATIPGTTDTHMYDASVADSPGLPPLTPDGMESATPSIVVEDVPPAEDIGTMPSAKAKGKKKARN